MNNLPKNYAVLSHKDLLRILDEEGLGWNAKATIDAARGGFLYLVPPELISFEIAYSVVGPLDRTLFHYAACRGELGEIPGALFTSSAMNQSDATGMTPFDYALDYEAAFGPVPWDSGHGPVRWPPAGGNEETAVKIERLILAAAGLRVRRDGSFVAKVQTPPNTHQ